MVHFIPNKEKLEPKTYFEHKLHLYKPKMKYKKISQINSTTYSRLKIDKFPSRLSPG